MRERRVKHILEPGTVYRLVAEPGQLAPELLERGSLLNVDHLGKYDRIEQLYSVLGGKAQRPLTRKSGEEPARGPARARTCAWNRERFVRNV
jgi:hypothetical protein